MTCAVEVHARVPEPSASGRVCISVCLSRLSRRPQLSIEDVEWSVDERISVLIVPCVMWLRTMEM